MNYKDDFPILSRRVYDKPLVYLDNAATTQKPRAVVEAITEQYYNVNANVHRGVHFLSQQATQLHEDAREKVRAFLGAEKAREIVFTRGTTESINLVASSFRKLVSNLLHPEVIVTEMEHHSNIVPWQLQGFEVKYIPLREDLTLDFDAYEQLFTKNTTIVSVAHMSNVLGVVNNINKVIEIAHEHNVPVMIDGAQSAPHLKINLQDLGVDFFAMSGHKIYGPTGIGVLYGKEELLSRLEPYQGGGEMIDHVSWEKTTFNTLPYKFEAGTPDYIGSHALAVALEYLEGIEVRGERREVRDERREIRECELTRYAVERLSEIKGLTIYGQPTHSVISFNLDGIHHLDVGTLLDRLGIAVRTGHHCAEPLMHRLGVEGTVRASLALYNTKDDIDALAEGLKRIKTMF